MNQGNPLPLPFWCGPLASELAISQLCTSTDLCGFSVTFAAWLGAEVGMG